MDTSISPAMLRCGPIRQIRLDLTENCNLRCVYCSLSNKDYVGIDMSDQLAKLCFDTVLRLSKHHALEAVHLNGNGETTYRQNWHDLVLPWFEEGIPVRIQSNFAKRFSDPELEALAGMQSIAISIDSADPVLLKKLRRHVDLRQIIANITLVRATALRLHHPPPVFVFACGLYDRNSASIEDLARLAVVLGVKGVEFWNLHRHEHQDRDLAPAERTCPLDDLTDEELLPRLKAILSATAIMRSRGIRVNVQGNFLDTLMKRVGLNA